ncbi:hypothetical protein [Cellulomonas biazotea]|uniref:Uncharacterized protein n=1 Tax=Cellulomonas biazotea TaxID=1709 RepID=A0A402DVQ3_9CELL|nr:hypothetical protein [Cellulomonas biazotea]GCE78162.1 hypothetical protein CBZ_32180 [Cellulomonas biazotea]
MPSYRVTATVGLLRPGTDAAAVLPAAVDAARPLATVEAFDVGVVRGQARVTVRFESDGDGAARRAARAVLERLDELAETEDGSVTRRYGNRWYPLRRPGRSGVLPPH